MDRGGTANIRVEVLESGLTEVVQEPVYFLTGGNSLTKLISRTSQPSWNASSTAATEDTQQWESKTILVQSSGGGVLGVRVTPDMKVGELMEVIAKKEGLDKRTLKAVYNGDTLPGDRGLRESQLYKASKLKITVGMQQCGKGILGLDIKQLAPEYDYDFTHRRDRGGLYIRGGEKYHRPYGWYRHALHVIGVYEDDTWLGGDGIRKHSSHGEWPVSYHGTSESSGKSIAARGYDVSMGKRLAFGKGIYTSPSIQEASKYATQFRHEGITYQIVFQNRVNPTNLKKFREGGTGNALIWLSPNSEDVRPYGILIRKTSP